MISLKYFPEEIKEHYYSFLTNEMNYNDVNKKKYNFFCSWIHLFDGLINKELLSKILKDKNNIKLISENVLIDFNLIFKQDDDNNNDVNKFLNLNNSYIKNKIINIFIKILIYLDVFIKFNFTKVKINGSEMGYGIYKFINIMKMNLLKNRLSKYEYKNVEINKKKFIKFLISKNIIFDKKTIDFFPKILFSDFYENSKEYTGHGCALELLKNPWYNLYLSDKFTFIPYLHGGGYNEWNDDISLEIEFMLSGEIPKFEKIKLNDIVDFQQKNDVFVALRSPVLSCYDVIHPSLTEHLKDQGNANLLLEIALDEDFFIRPSPKGLNNIYNKNLIYKSNISHELNNNGIFVFDALSSSLAYKLIKKNIPFIFILNKIEFDKLTKKYLQFLKLMNEAGGLLVSADKSEIIYFISALKNKKKLMNILEVNKKLYNVTI